MIQYFADSTESVQILKHSSIPVVAYEAFREHRDRSIQSSDLRGYDSLSLEDERTSQRRDHEGN